MNQIFIYTLLNLDLSVRNHTYEGGNLSER